MQLASSGVASGSDDRFCYQLGHSCVEGERRFWLFPPTPHFSAFVFVPHPGAPPNPTPGPGGPLSCIVHLSLVLPVSHHQLLAGPTDSLLFTSLFSFVQATSTFGHRLWTNLCPIFSFLLLMIILWKWILFYWLLFILSTFMSSAFMYKKVSGMVCISMKKFFSLLWPWMDYYFTFCKSLSFCYNVSSSFLCSTLQPENAFFSINSGILPTGCNGQ